MGHQYRQLLVKLSPVRPAIYQAYRVSNVQI